MSKKARAAAGGGQVVEIGPERLTGWVTRFAGRNDGLTAITADTAGVRLTAGNGTTATLAAPFPPMDPSAGEPVEALLHHLSTLGTAAVLLARAGAHCAGVVADGQVVASSTDRTYVQGRTAAGGWSQQRYARRRGNQKDAATGKAADVAARVLLVDPLPELLVLGGDRGMLDDILSDPRLAPLTQLRRREFPGIPEPRRVVLDELAGRMLDVEITIKAGNE